MTNLQFELKQICKRCYEGSPATQWKRAGVLSLIARDLHSLGYRQMKAQELGHRHIHMLKKIWDERGLATSTQMVYLSAIRFWAEKVGRAHCIAKANSCFGIGKRQHVATENRAQVLPAEKLALIKYPYV